MSKYRITQDDAGFILWHKANPLLWQPLSAHLTLKHARLALEEHKQTKDLKVVYEE